MFLLTLKLLNPSVMLIYPCLLFKPLHNRLRKTQPSAKPAAGIYCKYSFITLQLETENLVQDETFQSSRRERKADITLGCGSRLRATGAFEQPLNLYHSSPFLHYPLTFVPRNRTRPSAGTVTPAS